MTIRPAQAGDYSQIYSLVQTAFATAKVSDGTEQDFVLELRRRDTYRPELELVAEENGQLIGHILLTILPVQGAPQGLRGLMVAPLCVRLEDRSRGLGGQLLQEGGPPGGGAGVQRPVSGGRPGLLRPVRLPERRLPGVPKRLRRARPVFTGTGADPGCFTKRGGRAGAPLKPRRKSASVEEGLP